MAVLALEAEETFVNSWLGVALGARYGSPLENLIRMAGFARQRGVSAIQYEETRMIEVLHAIYPIVAIQAGRPVFLLVLAHEIGLAIIFRMAINTGLHIKTLDARKMAGATGHDLPIEIPGMEGQAKLGCDRMIERFTIQGSWRPSCGGMAMRTILVEHPTMCIRLGMALGTLGRHILEHIGHELAAARSWHSARGGGSVTAGAAYRGMLFVQREAGRIVVKTHHPVAPIMTDQAIFAKFLDVLGHKLWIVAGMTDVALHGCIWKIILSGMADWTIHWNSIITNLVP
jgi:hypothetical protein